jgi:hypothetical protein
VGNLGILENHMQLAQSGAVTVRYSFECIEHIHSDGSKCLKHGNCGRRGIAGLFGRVRSHTVRMRWTDSFKNLVVTTGRNALLDNTFNAAAGSVNWFVGLKGTGSVAAGDTLASHGGWSEVTPYSGNRPAWTKNGAASSGAMSNSSSKASYAITGSSTVYGAFLASVNSGTSGTLFGAGDFSASRAVENGDTLNVQVDLSITAS